MGPVIIGFGGVLLLFIGWFAPVALAAHRGGYDVLYSWGTVAYVLAYAMFLPDLIAAFVLGFPTFIRGLVLARTRHPAKKAVERTVARRRPDYEIERELWAIMRRQDATDAEIERRFHELSPWRRWALRLQYEKRAREARRLRDLAQTQANAYRAEGDLALSVHELERARRMGGER